MTITIQQFDGPPVFIVTRVCLSMPEAKAAESALKAIPEPQAWLPDPPPAPELTPAQQVIAEMGDEEAPTAHLKAGEANG